MAKALLVFSSFIAVIIAVVGLVLGAAVLTKLWVWFIVPTFAVQALTMAQALGIQLILFFMVPFTPPDLEDLTDQEKAEKIIKSSTFSVLKPALIFVVGWIITLFL